MKKHLLFLSFLAAVLLSSCSSRKDFVYLNDMNVGTKYTFDTKHEATVHRDDRLNITVSCKNPELALPFNIQDGNFQVGADGSVQATGKTLEKGYRVDKDGNIVFPLLGKLHVEGKTVQQVTDMISQKIIMGGYIKEPLVTMEFLNFKYTVLGAVGSRGTYPVKGDRITLLEAIAQAGDLTDKARIDRVAVIRETGNDREVYMHDLTKKNIFESPAFYLQQNDIVYVEPRYRKQDKEDRGFKVFGILTSLATLAISALYLVDRK